MSGKVFIDSNIFIYAYNNQDPRKQIAAFDLIRENTIDGTGVVSYQVVHEFFHFALVKAASKVRSDDAQLLLEEVFRPLQMVPSSFYLISDAIRIQDRYRLSWYDSLIVAAAQQAGCDVLYTEDLQHGQQLGSVTVRDPFR
jgi:predicted nucleic acid-binding protein